MCFYSRKFSQKWWIFHVQKDKVMFFWWRIGILMFIYYFWENPRTPHIQILFNNLIFIWIRNDYGRISHHNSLRKNTYKTRLRRRTLQNSQFLQKFTTFFASRSKFAWHRPVPCGFGVPGRSRFEFSLFPPRRKSVIFHLRRARPSRPAALSTPS